MSILSRFFKSKPTPPPTIEERIASLQSLSEPEIIKVVISAEEEKLRDEASRKITYGQPLLDLALGDSYPSRVNQVARQRIGQLLDSDETLVDKLVADTSNQSDLLVLTGYSDAASQKVFERINDESVLLDIALQGKTTQVRQRAAEKIEQRDTLESLLKAAKGKDKAVYKIAKTKLDVFKAEDARVAAVQARGAECCADAERLLKRDIDDVFKPRLEQIEAAWAALSDEAREPNTERYTTAIAACQKKIGEHIAAQEAEKALAADDEQARQDLLEAIKNLRLLIAGLYQAKTIDDEQEAAFNAGLSVLNSVFERVLERNLPIEKPIATYRELVEVAHQLWSQLKTDGALCDVVEALKAADEENGVELKKRIQRLSRFARHIEEEPAILVEAKAAIAEWAKEQKDKADKEKRLLKDLGELTRKANWAVNGGRVRQARGIFREITEKREGLESIPAHLEKKLVELEESIAKLGDWHTFAVMPKKVALVEEMEALVGADIDPDSLAEKIKKLQSDWKTLCKGGDNQDKELWERLQDAADKAFEPCRAHFAEQASEREQNLEKRRELITQMETYYSAYDWDSAVWKDVEQTLRVARETWQSFWPIPRKEIKTIQEPFDAILDKIHEKIKIAYDAAKAKKEHLVGEAEKLLELTDTAQAIESAKRLQSQWQMAGRSWRKDDQALWKAFRAHCDAIFEKRQQENEEVNQERQKEKEKAEEILQGLEAICEREGAEFLQSRNDIDELKTQYQSVSELPKKDSQKLATRYQQILEVIERRTEKEREIAAENTWTKLFALSERVGEYERNVSTGEASDLLEAIRTEIDSIERWPAGSIDLIEGRLKNAEASAKLSESDIEKTLRLLCIRMDILAEQDTPESDKALKMEFQVQQLQSGFGQGDGRADTLADLSLAWVEAPQILSDAVYQPLRTRFLAGRAALLS